MFSHLEIRCSLAALAVAVSLVGCSKGTRVTRI